MIPKCDICKKQRKCKKIGDDKLKCEKPDFQMRIKIYRKKKAFHIKNGWAIS